MKKENKLKDNVPRSVDSLIRTPIKFSMPLCCILVTIPSRFDRMTCRLEACHNHLQNKTSY